ncbi:MAG: BamA/TamA family outer membrane protein [Polyangia bacterium]
MRSVRTHSLIRTALLAALSTFAPTLALANAVTAQPISADPSAGPVADHDRAKDPTKLETDDHRLAHPKLRDYLLGVPRALLLPLGLVELGLGAIGKSALECDQKHHVADQLRAAVTSADGKVGIRPAFEYQQDFHPTAGLQYFYGRLWHGTKITVSTQIGTKNNLLSTGHINIPILEHRLFLDLDGKYRKRDDELYTGIGMATTTPYARYGVDQGDASVKFTVKFRQILKIDVSTAYGARSFNDGARYDGDAQINDVYCAHASTGPCRVPKVLDSAVPRFNEGTRFIRQHFGGHLDSRASELSAGNFFDINVDYTQGVAGDPSRYLRVYGRAGTALALWKHRVIYFSVRASDETSFDGSTIPFSELSTLGGSNDLRGFRVGRFRERSMLMATLEYRWPVWTWLDGALFADYGGVYGALFKGVDLKTLRPDVGFAFIAHADDKVIIRIQFAYGFGFGGGSRFMLNGPDNPS